MSIYITFTGQVPKILTWDGTVGSGWSVADFAERTIGNHRNVGRELITARCRADVKLVTGLRSSTVEPLAVDAVVEPHDAEHVFADLACEVGGDGLLETLDVALLFGVEVSRCRDDRGGAHGNSKGSG